MLDDRKDYKTRFTIDEIGDLVKETEACQRLSILPQIKSLNRDVTDLNININGNGRKGMKQDLEWAKTVLKGMLWGIGLIGTTMAGCTVLFFRKIMTLLNLGG